MDTNNLSPLAAASRDLVIRLFHGANPAEIEAGCRDLLILNTNGDASPDTRVVDVANEVIRGVLKGAMIHRSESITAATRGVAETGPEGVQGDADRLEISERTCLLVRDSENASRSDYSSALKGAANAALMTSDQLRARIEKNSPRERDGNGAILIADRPGAQTEENPPRADQHG